MSKTAERIASEIEVVRAAIESLEASVSEGEDFTPEQAAESDAHIARLAALQAEAVEAEKADKVKADADATVARIRAARPGFAVVRSEDKVPTAGEYLAAYIGSLRGDAQATKTYRALAQTFTTDTPGVVPEPIVGPLIDRYDSSRPVWSSFNPAGPVPSKTWTRVRVVEHVAVDTQSSEGEEVANHKWGTDTYTLTAKTIAGAVRISQQDVDWSSPSSLQKVADDFVQVTARRQEAKACAALSAAADEHESILNLSSISTFASSLDAARNLLEDELEVVNQDGVVLYVSPDQYTALTTKFTDQGVRWVDALGADMPRLIRARQLPMYTCILADPSAIDLYSTNKGLAQLFQLSTLEFELGTSAYYEFDFQDGACVDLVYTSGS